MRRIPLLMIVLAAVGCTQTTVSKIDYHTFKIEDSGVPGGSTAPDRRMAAQLCPDGYRVLNQLVRNGTEDGVSEERGQVFTTWTVRCL